MVQNKKRFVFVGCGKIAYCHADVILSLGHQIIGVAARTKSPTIGLFSEKYQINNCYDDFHKMFNKLQPDAVILCTSWDQTEKIIEDVINYDIPVLVEKPVALSSEKLKNVIKEVGGNSENVLVGYNRRFYDFVPDLKKAIFEQELLSVQLNFPEAVSNLKRQFPIIQNYILFYMSSHWLDLVLYLLGQLNVVVMQKKEKDGYVTSYNGLLKTVTGEIPIHYQSNFDSPQQTSIGFSFTDSFWELRPIEILSIYNDLERIEPTQECTIRKYMPKLEKRLQTDHIYKPGFYNQMKYFIDFILNKKNKPNLGCTLKDALKVTLLCEQINQNTINQKNDYDS